MKPTTKIRFTEPQIALVMRAHPTCNLDHLTELSFEFDQAGKIIDCSGTIKDGGNIDHDYTGSGLARLYETARRKFTTRQTSATILQFPNGTGVTQDKLLAQVWFALAASQGSETASINRDRLEQIDTSDIADQIAKAVAGDLEAQRNLAIRLYNGEGIQRDQGAAFLWVKRAADGGDAWAQTTFAIELRKTKTAESERESVRWLSLAADQGDPRARFNLGLQQLLGTGTSVDLESSAVKIIMASLAGIDEARKCFDDVRPAFHENSWERVFNRVKWSLLTIVMGPLVEGHLDGIRQLQETDDGSDNALWLEYERKSAETMFLGEGSPLDGAFGEQVIVKKIFVGRAIVEGKPVAAITISLRDILLSKKARKVEIAKS